MSSVLLGVTAEHSVHVRGHIVFTELYRWPLAFALVCFVVELLLALILVGCVEKRQVVSEECHAVRKR